MERGQRRSLQDENCSGEAENQKGTPRRGFFESLLGGTDEVCKRDLRGVAKTIGKEDYRITTSTEVKCSETVKD